MRERLEAIPSGRVLAAGLAVFGVLASVPLFLDGETADENMHLWAGYRHLVEGDFTPNPWHPPLAKLASAVPMVLAGAKAPEDLSGFNDVPPWSHGFAFLHRAGNSAGLLRVGRLATLAWGALLVAAVYWTAKISLGAFPAIVALVSTISNPTFLAHSALATTDVPGAALFFTATALVAWARRRADAPAALGAGVALGAALATKHGNLALLPALGLVLVFDLVPARDRSSRLKGLGLAGLGAAAAVAVLWASYGFRYAPSQPLSWWFPLDGLRGDLVNFAREWRLLPEPYLYGLAFLKQYSEQGHPAYALGQYSTTGWAWYFPFTFLVKTPTAALPLFAAGAVVGIRRALRGSSDALLFALPAVLYGALALLSPLNLGIRHLLPLHPFLALGAAALVAELPQRFGRAVPVLSGLALAGTLLGAPQFLAFFNAPSRMLAEPWQLLADSNLDWGQDLPRLKAELDRRGIASVKLGYFGNDSPRDLGLRHERLPGFNLYSRYEPEWPESGELRPGDWVAVSATCFVGALSPERRYYLDRLGGLKPEARIGGGSILLYRMPNP